MGKRSVSILSIFLILSSFVISAQDKSQKFYHLTRNSGLSQSTVYCIIKDSAGYMWFGTNEGVDKYNGYIFHQYKYKSQLNNTIGLGRVHTLFVDKVGRLWIGTDQGGLNLYVPEKDNFIRFQHVADNSNTISSNSVRYILETKEGLLWVATYGGGVNLFNPEDRRFCLLDTTLNLQVNCMAYDSKGNLWIGTDNGVDVLNDGINGISVENKPEEFTPLTGETVYSIYNQNSGKLWFGTYGNGAFSYNSSDNSLEYYSTDQPLSRRINHNIIRCFIEGEKGSIYFGTGGGGINIVDPKNNKIQYIENIMNNQYSLNSNIIYNFYRDDKDNLWIGTYNGGVNVKFRSKDKFNHIIGFGEKNNLSNNAVLSIIEDKSGKIWIGTDGGGLDLYDPIDNSFKYFVHDPNNSNSLSGNVIKSLLIDKKGILWVGTFNEGLNAFNLKTNKIIRYYHNPSNPNSISQNHIWDIEEDADGNIWLASLGGGLDCYLRNENRFVNFRNNPVDPSSLSDNVVSAIFVDTKNNIWIGTEFGGLCKLLDKEKGIFRNYRRSDTCNTSLSSNQICTIYEDSKNHLWIGTLGGGINLYLEDENRFIKFLESDGLSNNIVNAILEDNKGNLWISTNNGLSKFINAVNDRSKPKFLNYDASDGLQSNEFSPQSALINKAGIMYFGGINGMNYFYPDSIISNTHLPTIVLTDFKIFNKSVKIDEPGSPLSMDISRTKKIVLSHKQSVITFEYAALDFTMPTKNKYMYYLEGFEKNWNDVGNQRTATYTNLDPGMYTFRVVGSNNDGIWNFEGASVILIIKPPFYKTWLFRILVFLMFILIVFVFYKIKLKSLETQRRKLKIMVDERTKELLDLNTVLKHQKHEIETQSKELLVQKESLININQKLEISQVQIQQQNSELIKHRHNLEELVKQRTSELEQAKLKAEESDKLKMAFLSNMSHEIRTPMNAIIGFTSLLSEPDLQKEEKDDFIRQININGEALLVLIDDILDLSKIEADRIEIKNNVFNLHEFINDIYLNFKQVGESRNVIDFLLINNIDPGKFIETDQNRLRQILTNLLDNAFKFTSRGTIELSVTDNSKTIDFYVKDTGIGIEMDNLKTIFDRFRKVNDLGDKLYRGAGLGLTISQRLTELIGGRLWAESTLGQGSIFYLSIPLKIKDNPGSKQDVLSKKPALIDSIDLSGKTLLIVEDEKDSFLFLKGLLERKNAIIIWAEDGKKAVDITNNQHIDLVLMDIKMPVMNGYDAIKIMKKETPSIPIIAQTAFARPEEENKIRKAGFDDYISKPIKPNILFSILNKYI